MEKTNKKTKAMYFAELRELVENVVDDQILQEEYLEFIDGELEIINKRRVAAKERAEKKKAESDALTEAIYEVLHADYVTVDDIVEQLDDEDVSRNKVTSRLGKLVRSGKVEKEQIKVEDGKRMAYRRVTESVA